MSLDSGQFLFLSRYKYVTLVTWYAHYFGGRGDALATLNQSYRLQFVGECVQASCVCHFINLLVFAHFDSPLAEFTPQPRSTVLGGKINIFSGEVYIKHTTEGVLQSFLRRGQFWMQRWGHA